MFNKTYEITNLKTPQYSKIQVVESAHQFRQLNWKYKWMPPVYHILYLQNFREACWEILSVRFRRIPKEEEEVRPDSVKIITVFISCLCASASMLLLLSYWNSTLIHCALVCFFYVYIWEWRLGLSSVLISYGICEFPKNIQ